MRLLLSLLLILLAHSVFAEEATSPATYDAALAERLGGDEYGMKRYMLVILTTGPKTDLPEAERSELFRGHMANIESLAEAGKLVIAGPLSKNERGYRGIFVLNVATEEAAKELLQTDPAVAAGVFSFEVFGWYGSAALQETLAIHRRIAKSSP